MAAPDEGGAQPLRALHRAGLSFKKRRSVRPNNNGRMSSRDARHSGGWSLRSTRAGSSSSTSRGRNIAMTPRRGSAPIRERAPGVRPVNWGTNVTLMGAVRRTGVVALRPLVGAMNTDAFLHSSRGIRLDGFFAHCGYP